MTGIKMRQRHCNIITGCIAFCFAAIPVAAQTADSSIRKPGGKAGAPTLITRPPLAPVHMVGDRVQVYYNNWYPATIREVGKGDYRGFYRVAFDGFERQRWVDNDEVKAIPRGSTHPASFLSGTYQCYRRLRPKKAAVVDELYLLPNGDYSMRDDVRVGRYMIGAANHLIWEGGGLDDAESHVDGDGKLHIVRTRHIHWSDKDPKEMHCLAQGM